jgi:alanyl-tRNA synthetase
MNSSQKVRTQFLEFFKDKGHEIVPSAPIVVKDDPTLMFTNAGMNQFKDIFLETKAAPFPRVADTQKCLRVSGKHNDLEEVGHDTYHHTMFEMLGNWSFGDYYKKDAIAWAWELLTEKFKLKKDRLYVTVFGGDEDLGLGLDEEARREWKKWVPEERILNCGRKDNFWMMGDTGPCGPCSEIHIDLRSDEERKAQEGAELVNADHPLVVEIWNLVFIQYDSKANGSLEALPRTHVDTGMGFERLLMVLQDKQSTYDTDLFAPTREYLEKRTGHNYFEASQEIQVAMRVVMDHIRAITFAIADGQIPSNNGAGYVIRRVLRRASRYAFQYLGITEPFLCDLVALLADIYEGVFTEVTSQQEFIQRIIREEEKSFLATLERGTQMFDEYLREHSEAQTISGDFAFRLYDTFGFPVDLTQLMAREQGRSVDMAGFEKELQAQKDRSSAAAQVKTGDWVIVHPSENLPVFLGYDRLSLHTRILRYRSLEQKKKKLYQIVLEETPFYAESGGQIGDRGSLRKGDEVIRVLDTKKENELIVHFVNKLPQDAAGTWTAHVEESFREKVKANHSATHLMHAALRNHLGTHVEQRGSLVSDALLRFDFSHFARVSPEELQKIEEEVNEKIAAGIPLKVLNDVPIEEAKAMGAMALFGEKYGDTVRVVVFDPEYSVELCGGTHVGNSRDIRLFKFISESSSAAGIRRVEALTGDQALAYLNEQAEALHRIRETFKNPKDLQKTLEDLVLTNKKLEKELQALNAEKISRMKDELLKEAESINGLNLIRKELIVSSSDDLKQLAFDLKRSTQNTLVVLGSNVGGKAILSIIMSDDLAEGGKYHAGNMVRELAKEVKGGGGGQPFFATAGGKDPAGIPRALAKVEEML